MTLKRLVSACTPSYFVDAVSARRLAQEKAELDRLEAERFEKERAEREASSWIDAVTRAGSYDDAWLTDFRIARSNGFMPSGSLLSASPLGVMALVLRKPDISVTDFGGSTGDLGRDFLSAYPLGNYCVVETPSLVAKAANLVTGPRFAASIPDQCDIFYSSGALQYVENAMSVLEVGMRSAKFSVILRRNYFANQLLFSIQKSRLSENGSGPMPEGYPDRSISYPCRTLIEAEVHELAKRFGFRCVLNIEEGASPGGYSRQLAFWRD